MVLSRDGLFLLWICLEFMVWYLEGDIIIICLLDCKRCRVLLSMSVVFLDLVLFMMVRREWLCFWLLKGVCFGMRERGFLICWISVDYEFWLWMKVIVFCFLDNVEWLFLVNCFVFFFVCLIDKLVGNLGDVNIYFFNWFLVMFEIKYYGYMLFN